MFHDFLHKSFPLNRIKRFAIPIAMILCMTFIVTDFLGVGNISDNTKIAYADSGSDADDAKKELGEFAEIAGDFADDSDFEDMLEDESEIPGNLWSGLGGTEKFYVVFTKATQTVSFDDLASSDSRLGGASAYGYVLDRTGLDHSFSSNTAEEIIYKFGRIILGIFIIVGYFAQISINWIFGLVIKLADYVNVFGWLVDEATIKYGDGSTKMTTMDDSSLTGLSDETPFAGLKSTLIDLYTSFAGLGITFAVIALGISIGLAVFGWKVSATNKRTGIGSGMASAFGKFVFRLFIILATPVVVGSLFSGILDKTKDAYSGTSASDYAIYSNMVDFAKWVKHSRLALPDGEISGLTYTTDDGKISPVTHGTILNINAYGAGLKNARTTLMAYSGASDTQSAKLGSSIEGIDDAKETQNDAGVNDWGFAVIQRWMTMTEYSSSIYESYAKMDYFVNNLGKDKDAIEKDDFIKAITTDGTLALSENKRGATYQTSAPLLTPLESGSTDATIGKDVTRGGVTASPGGLSTLGMYNYLSTIFSSNTMTYTDTKSLVSKASAPYHTAVGLAGRGIVSFGNYMVMLSTIWSMAILGFMFAMYAVNALIVSIPKIVSNLIGTTIGSPKFFIKLLLSVIIVGIELLGGAILYFVAQKLIIGIGTMSDSMIEGVVAYAIPVDGLIGNSVSTTLYGVINVIGSILLLYVAIMMIKLRGKILGNMGQIVEDFLNNIFGTFGTHQTNNFQNGQNGLHTANENGDNQFTNIDGSKNSFSDTMHGRGEGDGSGSNNKGSHESSSKVHGAKSPLGKAYNTKAEIDDRLKAEENKKGSPLTNAEKAKVIGSELGSRTALAGLKGASMVMGSEKGVNLARDIDGIRDAKVENDLRKENNGISGKNSDRSGAISEKDANKDLARFSNDAEKATGVPGSTDTTAVVSDGTPVTNGAKSYDETASETTGVVPVMADGKHVNNGATSEKDAESNINANKNDTNNLNHANNSTNNITAQNDINSTMNKNDAVGEATNDKNIPVISNQNEGARALTDAKQELIMAEHNAKNAKTPLEQMGANEVLKEAEQNLKNVEQGVESFATQQIDGARSADSVAVATSMPIPRFDSKEQAMAHAKNAESVAEKSQQAYSQAVVSNAKGANIPEAKIQKLQDLAVQSQQKAIASQQAVNQFNNMNASSSTSQNNSNHQATSAVLNQGNATTSVNSTNSTNSNSSTSNHNNMNANMASTRGSSSTGNSNQITNVSSFRSVSESNSVVTKAKSDLAQATTMMKQATPQQQAQFKPKVENAMRTLQQAQNSASATFKQSPSSLVKPINGQRLTNAQTATHLQNVQQATIKLQRLTNTGANISQIRQARANLKEVTGTAFVNGVPKDVLSTPQSLENAMKKLAEQHQMAFNGVAPVPNNSNSMQNFKNSTDISRLMQQQADMSATIDKMKKRK